MAEQKNTASTTVTVACKIGMAWIDFEVCAPTQVMENTQTGAREVTQWVRTGKVVRVRGTAYPRGEAPEGYPEKPQMLMGYALTPNVPRDLWEQVAEQHKKAPYFTSGLVRAFASTADIKSYAADFENQMSGLEPIQRTKSEITDPRLPKSVNGAVTTVAPNTTKAA